VPPELGGAPPAEPGGAGWAPPAVARRCRRAQTRTRRRAAPVLARGSAQFRPGAEPLGRGPRQGRRPGPRRKPVRGPAGAPQGRGPVRERRRGPAGGPVRPVVRRARCALCAEPEPRPTPCVRPAPPMALCARQGPRMTLPSGRGTRLTPPSGARSPQPSGPEARTARPSGRETRSPRRAGPGSVRRAARGEPGPRGFPVPCPASTGSPRWLRRPVLRARPQARRRASPRPFRSTPAAPLSASLFRPNAGAVGAPHEAEPDDRAARHWTPDRD
jgi:hypothetical protein